MPTYDYQCSNGHQFEHLQSITSDPLAKCVVCGGPVRRLIGGGIGVIFKGSGFYSTDSKKQNPGNNPKSKDSETGDSKNKTESNKTESNKTESNKTESKSSNANGSDTSKSTTKTKS